ncbi:MAG: excisionase family DNA-binding protein [Sphaerochaeta sp.]|nr:excisionase family DNA-binding protein [Sphaerochaeta sp.]
MGNRWMRYKECAEYTQLSIPTIRKYVINQRMPFCRVSGCIIFDRQAIDAWIEARAIPVLDIAMKKAPLDMKKVAEVLGK